MCGAVWRYPAPDAGGRAGGAGAPLNMDVRQIRYFVHVAELGSFSKASRRLNVAQPALSRQVKLLEDAFGAQLLTRSPRGVVPTEAGAVLLSRGRMILTQLEELRDEVTHAAGHPSGEVVLGVPPSLAGGFAGPLVETCRSRFPDVGLRVIEGLSIFLEEWLTLGRIDLAVVTGPAGPPVPGRRELAMEEMMLVGSRDLTSLADGPVPLAEVARMDLTVTRGFRDLIDRAVAPSGLNLRYAGEFDSLHLLREMLGRGGCVTILPESLIHWDGYAREFLVRRIVDPHLRRRILCAFCNGRPQTPALRAVGDLLASTAAKLFSEPG